MDELRVPFDGRAIARHAKRLKREAAGARDLVPVRLAVLGGWTTHETVNLLDLFLLERGIRAEILQSEYNRYYEDAVLEPAKLESFRPQIVLVHTASVNLRPGLSPNATQAEHDASLAREIARHEQLWRALGRLGAAIIQNNYEQPVDPLGNLGGVALGGLRHFVSRLNLELAERARAHGVVLHDFHALAAEVGLERFLDVHRWLEHKILLTPDGSARLAHSLASVIAAMLGRARKCLVLDLDNTLWGGVIGDDGLAGIRLGRETPEGEAYTAFQGFCLELWRRGILLAVCSKNDERVAKEGFTHPDSVLVLEHFAAFKANFEPKHTNVQAIARELMLGLDALVFVDDNPAEREIVRAQLLAVEVPEIGGDPARYPLILAQGRHFEAVTLSTEDLSRARLYQENARRDEIKSRFADYDAYLASLEMRAEIGPIEPIYYERVTQLINKTNQFNLTTRRCTRAELEALATDGARVALAGRLAAKLGFSCVSRAEDGSSSEWALSLSARPKKNHRITIMEASA